MASKNKPLWVAMLSLGTVASFVAGNFVRVQQDVGPSQAAPSPLNVASIEVPTENPQKISESDYFYQLSLLLERDFVEPVTDEQKLAIGAVRGMIGGLWDPNSTFLPKDHFPEHLARTRGEFAGIGVEIKASYNSAELAKVRAKARSADPLMLLPELRVSFVAPGGPAEKAGMRVGDKVTRINDRWVLAWTDVKSLRDVQARVTKGQASPDELKKARATIQARAKTSMSIGRALDHLLSGTGKTIEIGWEGAEGAKSAALTTASTNVPSVIKNSDGTLALRLFTGAAESLATALGTAKEIRLDLRNSGLGDPSEVAKVLSLLVPAGSYGAISPERGGQSKTLVVDAGAKEPRNVVLKMDFSTRGSAAILGSALASDGHTQNLGTTPSDAIWIETVPLPDGSGYTLNTGTYRPKETKQ